MPTSTSSWNCCPTVLVGTKVDGEVRMGLELGGRGIRVNALSPGPTRTPGLLSFIPGNPDEVLASMASSVPLGRTADSAEIASAAVFLASDEASFVNGIEFFVDGGHAQV
jgi:NAD(P)-dependent dehydrogenase (short-subunit alcohol dehydrogenase family)